MIKICVKKDAKEAEKSASYIIPRKMNFVENCIYNSHSSDSYDRIMLNSI